jgi:hypothetical protein
MSKLNLHRQNNLIPNANTYVAEKKFISINSEDRDIVRYPDSSLFEIELPQDYLNVQSIRLASWSFPSNYNVFSILSDNVIMIFNMKDVYNPSDHDVASPLLKAIYIALTQPYDFFIRIEEGFYNPTQMANELTSKMNEVVTEYLTLFFQTNPDYSYASKLFVEYSDFIVTYNSVAQQLWFGNSSSGFTFPNNSDFYRIQRVDRQGSCYVNPRSLPSFSSWGLPAYLGFTRLPSTSVSYSDNKKVKLSYLNKFSCFWIAPSEPGANIHIIKAPLKINFMGPSYIYMELDSTTSLNCIDETNPYNLSKFTKETNQTNGRVNASFAKIAIPTTPISQWYDTDQEAYKWFDPPAERIRKLRIKLRYHDGTLVDFASFDYSIMLEFTLFNPQIQRKSTITSSDPSMF